MKSAGRTGKRMAGMIRNWAEEECSCYNLNDIDSVDELRLPGAAADEDWYSDGGGSQHPAIHFEQRLPYHY